MAIHGEDRSGSEILKRFRDLAAHAFDALRGELEEFSPDAAEKFLRMKFDIVGDSIGKFRELQRRLGTASPAKVVRKAFGLLDLCLKAVQDEGRQIVLRKDGEDDILVSSDSLTDPDK